jgi:hypothetical protein
MVIDGASQCKEGVKQQTVLDVIKSATIPMMRQAGSWPTLVGMGWWLQKDNLLESLCA